VVKLVDASDSKSDSERSAGSIPARGTILLKSHIINSRGVTLPLTPAARRSSCAHDLTHGASDKRLQPEMSSRFASLSES
jgi:hypothetical protein